MKKAWAVSVFAASVASVPPCACNNFELRIPRAGLVMINGIAGFDTFEVRTNV